MIYRHISVRRVQIVVGLGLAAGLVIQGHRAFESRSAGRSVAELAQAASRSSGNQAFASPTPRPAIAELGAAPMERLARRDPIAFFEKALDRYDRSVRDYTCTFKKQELVNGRMTELQVMEAKFRESPFSVRLKWIENQDKCSRVLYVVDRWLKNDQQMAVVEPGAIARLFVPYVMRPIHGRDAQRSSRRTLDQFGFRNSMALTLKYCKLASEQGVLDFAYKGLDTVNGRTTMKFERHLPYTGEDCVWPDRVLVVHVDKELLLPTLCLAYADDAKTELLGHYELADVQLNPGLDQSVFTKDGMGL